MAHPRYVGLRISTAAGAVPTVADIGEGELAINVADGRVYTLAGSTIIDLTDRYTTQQIDDLLDGKAAASHTHPWAEVTDKPDTATRWPTFTEVTDKPATYPPSSHSHSQYVQKVSGKGLSTEDYTTADRNKLAGVESGATADQTKADIDSLGVDADTVDGKHAADFDPAGSAAQVEHDIRDTLRQRPDPLLMHFL